MRASQTHGDRKGDPWVRHREAPETRVAEDEGHRADDTEAHGEPEAALTPSDRRGEPQCEPQQRQGKDGVRGSLVGHHLRALWVHAHRRRHQEPPGAHSAGDIGRHLADCLPQVLPEPQGQAAGIVPDVVERPAVQDARYLPLRCLGRHLGSELVPRGEVVRRARQAVERVGRVGRHGALARAVEGVQGAPVGASQSTRQNEQDRRPDRSPPERVQSEADEGRNQELRTRAGRECHG